MMMNPNSSSSSYSLDHKSLSNRLDTIFKKSSEISILCEIELCVIHYTRNGDLKTRPEDVEKVRELALRYNAATKRKKSIDLYGFLKKTKKITKTNIINKKAKIRNDATVDEPAYPIFDHYSPDQISQAIQSVELNSSVLQERLRFLEAKKQKKTNLDHHQQSQIHQDQAESLNPSSQFSLFLYNHGDATLPLSASTNFNQPESNQFTNYPQDYSALLEEYGLNNHLMMEELPCYDQNMCMGNNFQNPCVSSNTQETLSASSQYTQDYSESALKNQKGNDFEYPCVSSTPDYSALLQESINNYELSLLMQHGLYNCDQNMCMTDFTNNNVLDPFLSNTVPDEFCSDFQDPCGYMMGRNTSFSQEYFPNMSSSYDVQTSSFGILRDFSDKKHCHNNESYLVKT